MRRRCRFHLLTRNFFSLVRHPFAEWRRQAVSKRGNQSTVPRALTSYLHLDKKGRWDLNNENRLRVLLVASSGGHLSELVRLFGAGDDYHDFVWVTFDGEQARSLLAGSEVVFAPYVSPRDPIGLVRAGSELFRKLGDDSFDLCVSTGSAIALAAYWWGLMRCVPCIYIESVARTSDLSATGKIASGTRLATVFSQERLARRTVPIYVSVLSTYKSFQYSEGLRSPRRVFVTLGTISPYRFDRLVDTMLELVPDEVEMVWQLGSTKRSNLPGIVHDYLPEREFINECREADVVVCHGGVGTVMSVLDLGKCPVVVPRRRSRREHVDDHQSEICEVLERSEIGVVREADNLTIADLEIAVSRGVENTEAR